MYMNVCEFHPSCCKQRKRQQVYSAAKILHQNTSAQQHAVHLWMNLDLVLTFHRKYESSPSHGSLVNYITKEITHKKCIIQIPFCCPHKTDCETL